MSEETTVKLELTGEITTRHGEVYRTEWDTGLTPEEWDEYTEIEQNQVGEEAVADWRSQLIQIDWDVAK